MAAQGQPNDVPVRGDEDPLSPTTMIFKAIQAQGKPLNAANKRAYMQQLRSSPHTEGQPDIESDGNTLTVQRDDSKGSVANKVEGQGQRGNAGDTERTGPAEPRNYENIGGGSSNTGGSPSTSAQPSNLGAAILGGGAGMYAADWLANRGNTGERTEPWNVPLRPVQDVDNPAIGGPGGTPQVSGPDMGLLPPQGNVSPMEAAMQKALAPAGAPVLGAGDTVPQLGLTPRPPIPMPDETSGPTIAMPPPEPPASAGGAALGRPSVTIETMPQLSGRPPPFAPGITTPGNAGVTIQPVPKLSGRPPPIDFGTVRGLTRLVR